MTDPRAIEAIARAKKVHAASGRHYLSPQFWGPEHFRNLNAHYVKHGFDDRVVDPQAATDLMKTRQGTSGTELN
jgi:hypothetical protein